jgi:transcriptional regulator, XRE family
MFKQKFAENLKRIRKSRKLTQEQLAEIVGVDFRYISFIENARSFPSCELIEKLSEALNVDYSDLFSFDENLSRQQYEMQLLEIVKLLDDKNLKTLLKIAKDLV